MSLERGPVETKIVAEFEQPIVLPENDLPVVDALQSFEDQKPGEACGVIGIYAPGLPVAKLAYYGLHELQHRGQNGAGVVVNGRLGLVGHKGRGLIDAAIPELVPMTDLKTGKVFSVLDEMTNADTAVGHTRYDTSGKKTFEGAQPNVSNDLAVVTNGHVEILSELEVRYDLSSANFATDSEFIAALYGKRSIELDSVELAVLEVSAQLNGAFSTVIMDKVGKKLIGIRDPWAFRPLSLGVLPNSKGYMFASEPAGFEVVGATFVRDLEKGEIVVVDENGPRTLMMNRNEEQMNCMYEYIYFARPDSTINGVSVYLARENMGRFLAIDHPVNADIVVGVRESGTSAAIGYSKESGLPKEEGLFKNPYVARSFIEDGEMRDIILGRKQRVNRDVLEGMSVVLVDDSIIKGNTINNMVKMLRDAGATEVHVRSAAPRYMHPCYMGMDTRDASKLIARGLTDEEICAQIGADSIAFNSVGRVKEAVRAASRTSRAAKTAGKICDSCVTGKYPFATPPCQAGLVAKKTTAFV